MSSLHLYADYGCPFAHRVAAFLAHLGEPYELHECSVGFKPEGLSEYSPSGRIPLLVHDELVLTESRVILEYLAERFDYTAAFPSDLNLRARHRLSLALVDEFFAPRLFAPAMSAADRLRFEEVLRVLGVVLEPRPSPPLLTFTIGPFWHQLRHRTAEPAIEAILAHAELVGMLNRTLDVAAIADTAPNLQRVHHDVQYALANGLIAPPS